MAKANVLTDQMWQAIVSCDSTYDHTFYYGVSTTGVFCRPSCKSRTPAKENVLVFHQAEDALSHRFRPCKRCRPDGLTQPVEEWTAQMADWISGHYEEPVTLERLAAAFHSSPYHLQRTFKKIEGVTPAVYLLRIRMEKAKELLAAGERAVSEIASCVGIPGAAHFSTLFLKMTGLTPTQYRQKAREAVKRHDI